MNALPTPTYGSALSPTKSPRDAEATILARITARMVSSATQGQVAFPQLVEALSDNRRFWSTCAGDLAADGNSLPIALRAQLISLADFVQAHTARVLSQHASIEPLTAINRAIIEGLSAERLAA
ncbi:flagellar biosynthesis regulatory protein FlaF [Paracoccus suum]|uniref:Flagellar biosynthesis regulatory protein FlaF n=2 Tax=Paracoccus suum TaxID=2259340 RepID=A0A344PIH7_9RHOB|nr:flagellar biosynthesis regulatory protein FlaF [Paracoccus suum]